MHYSHRQRLLSMALAAAFGSTFASLGSLARAQVSAPEAQAPRHDVNVPAQGLAAALNELSRQTGTVVFAASEVVSGIQSRAVSGRLTARQALERLLAGTPLQVEPTSTGGFAIQRGPLTEEGLPPVTVSAKAQQGDLAEPFAGGQVARGGRIGLLGTTDIMDAPFNQTSYTSDTIQNQQAQSLADVLANDPSVQDSGVRHGPAGNSMVVRGFPNGSSLGAVTFNGLQGGSMYKQSPELYERVEIIKGLDSMVNGMSAVGYLGGNINLVPKRAGATPTATFVLSHISNEQVGRALDAGLRFGQDKAWGVRLNSVIRKGETPWKKRESDLAAATLGLDYRSDRLRASLDYLHQEVDIRNAQPVISFAAGVKPVKPPSSDSALLLGQMIASQDVNLTLRADYDITDRLNAFFGASESRFRGEDTGAAIIDFVQADGGFRGRLRKVPYAFDNRNLQAGLRSSFTTGAVGHKLVLSIDQVWQEGMMRVGNGGFGTAVFGNLYAGKPVTAPRFVDAVKAPWQTTSRTSLLGVALVDTLSFMDERVLLTLGLRNQRVHDENYQNVPNTNNDKTAVTPLVGLVVKPWTGVSLYANVIEGLQQGATVTFPATAPDFGKTFAPYQSKQVEIGAKWDLGDLATTLSLFQIKQPSLTTGTDGYSSLDGEQRNRGLEWQVFGKATRQVSVLGGLAYTDAELVKTAGGLNDGHQARGVSKLKANLGAEWAVAALPGFSVSGRVVHTGPAYIDQANLFRIGSWTRYDAGVRYETRLAQAPLALRANIENLFDKNYWIAGSAASALLSSPRTIMLSASLQF